MLQLQMFKLVVVCFVFAVVYIAGTCECVDSIPYAHRHYDQGNIVCVCNATYCDNFPEISSRASSRVDVYESNKAGLRFSKTTLNANAGFRRHVQDMDGDTTPPTVRIVVDRNTSYQDILGFGGAFTDAAGINIYALQSNLSKLVIDNYYSSNGLEYTIGRIPIGGSDFSTRKYTYDDHENDFNLANFSLADEDIHYKIPLIKQALNTTKRGVKLFASAWSSPAWMKTNNDLAGKGTLRGEPGGEYYTTWANYYVKFLDAYQSNGISVWGITTGNEPLNGFVWNFPFNCMAFSPELQRDFIKLDLGPKLAASGYGPDKLKIMIMDDQRMLLPEWANIVLSDADASQYVSGIGFHWYTNALAPPELLDLTHQAHPDKFILSTEACEGSSPLEPQKVVLGSWQRAENYAKDIIEDLLHWTNGWVDWNLAVDTNGGPNWASNFVDSPIIVNASANEFYKQPMFYALGQFSKFLAPGSKRIRLDLTTVGGDHLNCFRNVIAVGFVAPDDATVIVILNSSESPITIQVEDPILSSKYETTIDAHSIVTLRN